MFIVDARCHAALNWYEPVGVIEMGLPISLFLVDLADCIEPGFQQALFLFQKGNQKFLVRWDGTPCFP
jgi:hypothetical protein